MRFGVSVFIVLSCLALILDACHPQNLQNPGAKEGDIELKAKQALLNRDLQNSDLLCRSQCISEFKRAQNELQTKPDQEIAPYLQKLQKEHPHFKLLLWSRHDQPLEGGIQKGELDEGAKNVVTDDLKKAKEAVIQGQTYISPRIESNNRSFFVLGVPAKHADAALIGVVEQDFLRRLEIHQKRNLKMVPYPSEGKFSVESVDPGTLRDVKVRHPEENEGTSHIYKNEVVVKFKRKLKESELRQILGDLGVSSYQSLGNTYVFKVNGKNAGKLEQYFKNWDVEYVEPHFLYLTNQRFVPNDSLYSMYQWNLPLIRTEPGWNITRGMKEVVVAVVDTGVDLNHHDLAERLVPGYNALTDSSSAQDDVGHGTHVAGIIAATVNNHEGIAGMSWYNRIMPVKVLDYTGSGSTYAVAKGIIWATDHGAKVINLSLGNYVNSEFLHEAIRYAYDRDVVLISASGNDNTEQPGYPAAYPEVFAVSATDENKLKAEFSNYGDYIDAAAPGVSIASTYLHNQYAALSGTSMASPHAAALAALIRSVNPLLSNDQVMEIMRKSTQDLGMKGKDRYYGHGLIDVNNALTLADKSRHSLFLWSEWLKRKMDQLEEKYAK